MKVRDIIKVIEDRAPLRFQDDFDNSGLQVGDPEKEVSKVLVCLDVTEAVVREAVDRGCGLIVSHHPLIFKALKQIAGFTYQQRCVVDALLGGVAIYSAHTSLDNAPGGVNHKIASLIGLTDLEWLSPKDGGECGSGVVGTLELPEKDSDFITRLSETFGAPCLQHSATTGRKISKVAVCGGAGAFLMRDAISCGADCFVSGEFHYHDFFENKGMILAGIGHFESEQFTQDLLCEILSGSGLEVVKTDINTNPIVYGTER